MLISCSRWSDGPLRQPFCYLTPDDTLKRQKKLLSGYFSATLTGVVTKRQTFFRY